MSTKALIAALIVGAVFMIASRKTWAVPQKGMEYAPVFQAAEYQHGLPPRLLARVAQQESDFNPAAFNQSSGAVGMMQIIPRWHPGVDAGGDPRDDIFYAARYLRENFDKFGSWSKALAAYNWGPGNLAKAIEQAGDRWLFVAPRETQDYVINVTGDLGLA